MDPRFSTVRLAIVFSIPNILIFLGSGGRGESSPALKILIPGYGKKSYFRGGTPSLCIKSESGQVGTTMFRSGQGVEWYQVESNGIESNGRMVPQCSARQGVEWYQDCSDSLPALGSYPLV